MEERCHCPVCEHTRAIECGMPHIQQCGDSRVGRTLPAFPDVLPVSVEIALVLPLPPLADRPLLIPVEPPAPEVRTPPPLA
jgi:hypothetical protein